MRTLIVVTLVAAGLTAGLAFARGQTPSQATGGLQSAMDHVGNTFGWCGAGYIFASGPFIPTPVGPHELFCHH